jgi:HTH-type transcriptional regulator / antitoxin MqsA
MSGDICPICAKGHLVSRAGRYETKFTDRGGEIGSLVLPELQREECDACGEVFLDDSATQRLEAARRNAMGLLSASEIRELRRRLCMTQSQISSLLGIGEKTYCRWESGDYIQSVAFDNYLRLVRELPEAIALLARVRAGGTRSEPQVMMIEAVFPSLRDVGSLMEVSETFTRLMEGGRLLAV